MRLIGPEALSGFLGDRAVLHVHAGAGEYHRYIGRLAEGRDENQEQFYVENAIRTVGSKPVSLPIRHGDGVTLHVVSKNEREDIRDYSFRDDSD